MLKSRGRTLLVWLSIIPTVMALCLVARAPSSKAAERTAFDPAQTQVVFAGRKEDSGRLFEIRFYPGGNLFVLDAMKPGAKARNLTNLTAGDVQDPEVSYDGKKVLFSMRRDVRDTWHLWEINPDGTGLKQLTFGPQDDVDPAYLPDGRIAFCSTRPGFLDEYHREPAALLHVMNADGSGVEQISFNISHDVTPTVISDGRILYPRWEHHGPLNSFPLFAVNPDGTGFFEFFGAHVPPGFFEPQELSDGRLVAVLSPESNKLNAGPLGIIDATRGVSATLTNITSDARAEITEMGQPVKGNKYRSPYPLPDGRLLVSYCERGGWDFGIYTMDLDGKNRQLVYNDPNLMEFNPTPILPRRKPPVIPPHMDARKRTGTFFGMNAYLNTFLNVPKGDIKAIRVVEGLPRPAGGDTKVSINRIHEVKRILGDAPVYPDGSFYFEAPANVPLHFQTIGKDGMVLTNERTWLWLKPGENRACIGCHEARESSPPTHTPLALQQPPTKVGLDPEKIEPPVTFVKDVQPILSAKCVKCHSYSDADRNKLPAGNLDFAPDDSYAYNVAYANVRYAAVDDSNARTSYLVWKISGAKLAPYARARARRQTELKGKIMPPPESGITLTEREKQTIIKWIELGAVYRDYETQGYQAGSSSKASAAAMVFAQRCGNAGCHDGRKASALDVNLNSYPQPLMRESVNYSRPENSLLLRAALSQRAGGLPHAGGEVFKDTSDPDYQTLLAYIRESAKNKRKIGIGDNAGY